MNHDIPMSGHQGEQRTIDRVKAKYFWYRMSNDIIKYVSSCPRCSVSKKLWIGTNTGNDIKIFVCNYSIIFEYSIFKPYIKMSELMTVRSKLLFLIATNATINRIVCAALKNSIE